MGLAIVFVGLLLLVTEITFQGFIGIPVQLLDWLGSLLFYGMLGLGILILLWIVGE
jgi:hypothetical protein